MATENHLKSKKHLDMRRKDYTFKELLILVTKISKILSIYLYN